MKFKSEQKGYWKSETKEVEDRRKKEKERADSKTSK